MPTQDPEILIMARCRRLIEPLSPGARQRVANYLASLAGDMEAPKPKEDARQLSLPGAKKPAADSPFEAA